VPPVAEVPVAKLPWMIAVPPAPDVPAEELMFSFQSENIDISQLDKISKSYSATLVAQLKKEKLLVR